MHVISYTTGQDDPIVVTNYDADEDVLRAVCASLVGNGMDSVTLHALDAKGIIAPVAKWGRTRDGKVTQKRNAALPPIPTPQRVADDDLADDEEADEELVDSVDDTDDDSPTYDGFCVKCRAHREFHGEIVEMANGRRRAKGDCPVCGTGISRILSNVPVSDDYETPDDENPDDDPDAGLDEDDEAVEDENPDDDPDVPDLDEKLNEIFGDDEAEPEPEEASAHQLNQHSAKRRGMVTLACACGEWESAAIKVNSPEYTRAIVEFGAHAADADNGDEITISVDAPEGTPVEEIAEAVADQAEEIAEAAAEAEAAPAVEFQEPAKPRKRTTKANGKAAKAGPKAGLTEDEQRARDMKVRTCPQCSKKIPVMERAGLEIYTVHPNADKGLDRCPGSTTTVN